jgi:hypothetical protein
MVRLPPSVSFDRGEDAVELCKKITDKSIDNIATIKINNAL